MSYFDSLPWISFEASVFCHPIINELDHHTDGYFAFFSLIDASNDFILLSECYRRDKKKSNGNSDAADCKQWKFPLWTYQIHQQNYSSMFSIIKWQNCRYFMHHLMRQFLARASKKFPPHTVSIAACMINLIDSWCIFLYIFAELTKKNPNKNRHLIDNS